ncbi:hypothetical protein KEM52_006375 [Ascosphaera acerosa]|nr:hypothetical protein KEM52_006375 [Ascosphaera acerosa]
MRVPNSSTEVLRTRATIPPVIDWDDAHDHQGRAAVARAHAIADGSRSILDLPAELFNMIVVLLDPVTLANARLTCRTFAYNAPLRIPRVFLSANSLNIRVFNQIASHEYYRRRVKEIVYDDSQLYDFEGERATAPILEVHRYDFHIAQSRNVQDLVRRAEENGLTNSSHSVKQLLALECQLGPKQSWKYHMQEVKDQTMCIETAQDMAAFAYGLKQFINLERITLTAAAHGFLWRALYRTPMIRAMPFGLNRPIPRGWRGPPPMPHTMTLAWPWNSDAQMYRLVTRQYRGFCVILDGLRRHATETPDARCPAEFVVDCRLLKTGLNPRIFDNPCYEYQGFKHMISRPGFRHLDLTFTANLIDIDHLQSYRNGLFRAALSCATDLEYFAFTSVLDNSEPWLNSDHYLPLDEMFPVDCWPRLKHFGLIGWHLEGSDLMDFLASMPPTVTTIELSSLHFVRHSGRHETLLESIRDNLDWYKRPPPAQPRLMMRLQGSIEGRAWCLDQEANDFVYRGGPNPFGSTPSGEHGMRVDTVMPGFGREIDLLDPLYGQTHCGG